MEPLHEQVLILHRVVPTISESFSWAILSSMRMRRRFLPIVWANCGKLCPAARYRRDEMGEDLLLIGAGAGGFIVKNSNNLCHLPRWGDCFP